MRAFLCLLKDPTHATRKQCLPFYRHRLSRARLISDSLKRA